LLVLRLFGQGLGWLLLDGLYLALLFSLSVILPCCSTLFQGLICLFLGFECVPVGGTIPDTRMDYILYTLLVVVIGFLWLFAVVGPTTFLASFWCDFLAFFSGYLHVN
jgi:hypothetical protein